VIVGSSAGALIGLHFVVIAQIDRVPQPAAEAGCRNGKMLQLLFIGIQNAGDAATYHIFVGKKHHETNHRRIDV